MTENIQRILSIDGGGVRGIIPATVLASIEERTGKRISELFDLIAGTSTGGILALGLTKPDQSHPEQAQFSASQLCQLYQEKIPLIFQDPQSWWGNLIGPKYKSFALQAVLKEAFGECRLKGALSHVLIPCYDIEHRVPYLFNSRLARIAPEHDFQMRDVALAASASPTVFHPVRFPRAGIAGRPICLVDGGVFANNPSICALSESRADIANNQKSVFIVSLGTGKSHRTLSDEFVSLWGYVQWSVPMLELVMESNSECVHQQIQHLMPHSSYHRVQVELNDMSAKLAIDDASSKNLKALKQCADEFCSEPKNLEAICNRLLLLSECRPSSFID